MSITERRLERAWSQEDLADVSGLSVRTIQRAETGRKNIGLETLKALAAVFETDVSTLIQEQQTMTLSPSDSKKDEKEKRVISEVRRLKRFYMHVISFVILVPALAVLDFVRTPETFWIHYVALGWGAGLLLYAIFVFSDFRFLGSEWEQREFEKRMQR